MAEDADTGSAFWHSLEKRIHFEWLAISLLALSLTVLASLYSEQSGIARVDHTFYDGVLRAAPARDVGDDIILIAIDDSSIEQLGRWPWRRNLHAQLLDHLSQARRVGFDIVFLEASDSQPQDDHLLADAIARHGRVILPTILMEDANGVRQQTPLPILADAAVELGYINVYPESDGVVRSLTLQREAASGALFQHFVLAMEGRTTPDDSIRNKTRRLPYAGPAGHFPFYPYAAVLNGDIPPERFKDRVVLVGAWSSGLGDTFPTPMTRQGDTMSGMEILANGLHALEHQRWIRTASPLATAVQNGLPVLLVCLLLRRLSPRRSFLAAVAITTGWVGLSATLLLAWGYWMPITAGLIGIALCFVLWTWRSQEASLQHIDQELWALEQATPWNPAALTDNESSRRDRSLPTRIRLLHQAIARFRHAQKKREETLRFLSHDMRAPQNAILALIEMQQRDPETRTEHDVLSRIAQRATDTLELMDGFVQLERAEVIPLERRAIDLTDLLHQACDAFWEQAAQRGISLELDTLPEHAWVEGDPQLLSRVLRNLIDNAIKYSADHTHIFCSIQRTGARWDIRIQDQGQGIPPAQLERIFDPFARIAADSPGNAGGAGLGLAFVRTTMQRHKGSITAHSQAGEGSTFTISLPALEEDQP